MLNYIRGKKMKNKNWLISALVAISLMLTSCSDDIFSAEEKKTKKEEETNFEVVEIYPSEKENEAKNIKNVILILNEEDNRVLLIFKDISCTNSIRYRGYTRKIYKDTKFVMYILESDIYYFEGKEALFGAKTFASSLLGDDVEFVIFEDELEQTRKLIPGG